MDSPIQRPDGEASKSVEAGDEAKSKGHHPEGHIPGAKLISPPQPPNTPPTPPQGEHADNGKNNPPQRTWNAIKLITLIVEICGLLGLLWYCLLTRGELKVFDSERLTMEKSQIQDERAWVFQTDVIQDISDKNDSAALTVFYKNTGKTPALNVQAEVVWTIDPNKIPEKDAMPSKIVSTGLCAPQESNRIQTLPPIPAYVMANIASTPIYIYGTIWYDDVFGGHHWSQFCFRTDRSPINMSVIQLNHPAIHNSCDDAQGK